ncbi:CTLH/CRA C-terminal to lish motif domain-containing protein [Syncephalis fuscata]|nr:CTLH/CRA C-terminal to lish motif domain-containing protein [Syncephalis fuscata]
MYRIQQESILALEQPLLKVPYEQLRRHERTRQKYCEKEFGNHQNTMKKLCRDVQQSPSADTAAMTKVLDGMAKRLGQLKRKLLDIDNEQQQVVGRIDVRFNHLSDLCHAETFESTEWRRWADTKVNRVLADYLLRENWHKTADQLVHTYKIEKMVDSGLFDQAQLIASSLLEQRSVEALKWCTDNKNGLRKIKNTLEFQLRIQDFVELTRQRQNLEAIQYARTHFTSLLAETLAEGDTDRHEELMRQVCQTMTLLAFDCDDTTAPYHSLYSLERWHLLKEAFLSAHVKLHSLPLRSLLSVSLQAGLSTLKTIQCSTIIDARLKNGERDTNAMSITSSDTADTKTNYGVRAAACPACAIPLDTITAHLPRAHHEHSLLICRISGRLLGGSESACCGPNGEVYSRKALEELAAQNNGIIRCPITGDQFQMKDVQRVFIM